MYFYQSKSQRVSSYPLEKIPGHEHTTGRENSVCLLLNTGFILHAFEDQTSKFCQTLQMTTKKFLLQFFSLHY